MNRDLATNFFYTDDLVGRFIINDFLTFRPNRKMTPQGIAKSYMSFLRNHRDIDKEKARIMAYKDLEGMKFLTWHFMRDRWKDSLGYNFAVVTEYQDGKMVCIDSTPYETVMEEKTIKKMTERYPDLIVCQLG